MKRELPKSAARVLTAIERGELTPFKTVASCARMLDISPRSFRRALRVLNTKGYIRREPYHPLKAEALVLWKADPTATGGDESGQLATFDLDPQPGVRIASSRMTSRTRPTQEKRR